MENETLQKQLHLIRTVEAALKVVVPDAEELQFRGSLLNCATAKLADFKPGMTVRLYEAACDVKFPTEDVTRFRHNLQRAIGRNLDLRSYRIQPAPAPAK